MRSGERIVWFATGNRDKFREAVAILAPFGITVRHLKRSKIEIQDMRLENIARYALDMAIRDVRRPVVIEDSGLFIESLAGFPGPYSSFVYGTIGLKGILALMRGEKSRRAFFQSTIAFGSPRSTPRLFTGRVEGSIARRIVGSYGFGYDPIFVPDGSRKTFGQTDMSIKNRQSHRARAFRSLARWFVNSTGSTVGNEMVREP